jgi:hypothetical protein
MTFTKNNVLYNEYYMQDLIYNKHIINVPKVYEFKCTNNGNSHLVMEKIPELNISDMYGDCLSSVPDYIIEEARCIISILYRDRE